MLKSSKNQDRVVELTHLSFNRKIETSSTGAPYYSIEPMQDMLYESYRITNVWHLRIANVVIPKDMTRDEVVEEILKAVEQYKQ